jgi:hypothetical protein
VDSATAAIVILVALSLNMIHLASRALFQNDLGSTKATTALLHDGPSVRRKAEAIDSDGWSSVIVAIIVVIHEGGHGHTTNRVGENALTAWADDVVVGTQQDCSATVCQS